MHNRISVNSLCFPGATLSALSAHWQALDARRVSTISPLLDAEGLPALRAALESQGAKLETIAHAFLGGRHLSTTKADWGAPQSRLLKLIEQAESLGAQSIYMTTGGHGELLWEQAAEVFSEMVAPCAKAARQAGISLMIENAMPLYADMHIAHSLRDTIALADKADIGVCIDLFACWMEADLAASIARAVPRCGLVQVSDYVYGDRSLPSRAVPGDGAVPLEQIFAWLHKAGYEGAFDLELIGPRIDAEGHRAATQRCSEYLTGLLNKLER